MTTRMGLLIAMIAFAFGSRTLAQYAPDGNAHPATQDVSNASGFAPPFGLPDPSIPETTVQEKVEFSKQVDLTPLRDLSVFHNGRVKIMDTLSRETVSKLMGAKKYIDYVPETVNGKPAYLKYRHDPLFTWIDLMIEPRYYVTKPLLGVDYLPLRRAFMEAEYPDDQARQDRELKRIQLAPSVYVTHVDKIYDAHMMEQPYRAAFDKLQSALSLWERSPANLLMVAPAVAEDPWQHLSSLPANHPARVAATDLGKAWRARNAAGVNTAAVSLAAALPTINPTTYPTTARSLELMYNRSNAFEWGFWGYFLSLVALVLAFGTGRGWLAWLGTGLLVASVAMHAFGFIARCLIAERFAIQNQFESMTGLSLFAAVVGLGIMLAKRQWLYGAASAGVGFLVLITATQTNIPGKLIEREAAILNTSVLLKYHVTTVLVSYGLIALGFIISLFYLGTHYFAKKDEETGKVVATALGTQANKARTLGDLDTAQMTVLQLAFWTLGVGILLGAWWADHSWGRWWAFDPKETWALITWIVYLIAIHTRFGSVKNKGLTTAWLSVAGFVVMLFTYFGVNLLLPGLHAYA
ncbi:MAG: cytochrome c biogenesis protein CcsA [Tepidisphaera sp.]